MTTNGNNSIRAIDKESVHRICSGQVVLDMATAVKELLENSLDAGATSIVIKFKQSGLDNVTVADNGCGITDANLETLALKHYTSKLRSFSDLAQVRSFGFRGEALSSLCALATLTVTTSTGANPTGVLVEYTSDGVIKSKSPTPMTKGTIVKICNLFEGMPVRRSEFVKNIKREYSKCIGLIQAYALIVPNVRISCVSQMDKKPAATQIATSGNTSVRQNIINVFGPKAMIDVVDFELRLIEGSSSPRSNDGGGNDEKDEDDDEQNQSGDITLTGFISSPAFGKGRSSADRQYIFINGRPCMLPKIARVINEVYHSFNTNQSPFIIANLILPTSYYDVNVSPDKRTIFLHNERMIVEELRNKMTELFEPSRSTFAVSEARQLIKKPDLAVRLSVDEGTSALQNGWEGAGESESEGKGEELSSPSAESVVEVVSLSSLSRSHKTVTRLEQTTLTDLMRPAIRVETLKRKATDSGTGPEGDPARSPSPDIDVSTSRISERDQEESSPGAMDTQSHSELDVMEGYDPLDDTTREIAEAVSDSEEEKEYATLQQPSRLQRVVVLDSEVHHDGNREWIEVGFNLEDQRNRRKLRLRTFQETRRLEKERGILRRARAQQRQAERHQSAVAVPWTAVAVGDKAGTSGDESIDADQDQVVRLRRSRRLRSQKLSDASFANMDDAKAQSSLSRVISKGDFARMRVLGQFNKAFIVVRLDNHAGMDANEDDPKDGGQGTLISSDIFVIDQHASDEKYNFETLQAKTVLSTQRLFQPKKLYLTAQEEITVMEHMKMLNKNGFYLDHDPNAPVSHRLKLVTLPVSEKVVFDLQDFEELVFLLSQQTALPVRGLEEEDHPHSDHHHHQSHGSVSASKHSSSLTTLSMPEKMVRCSKVRSLFASRACRRSVMIGHVLNHSQMKKIVRHMGEIDQPWNCPHGRPTMRHLLDLAELEQQERRARVGLDSIQDDPDDREGGDMEQELGGGVVALHDRLSAFEPIALKRPTRHQGSLFRFMVNSTPIPPPPTIPLSE